MLNFRLSDRGRPAGSPYGVDSTIVVRVDTFANRRICWSSSSSATGDAARTLRM